MTGMVVDKPDPVGAGGTTTTGNIARNLLFDPVQRKVLVECVPEKARRDGRCDRDVFGEFVTNLSSCFLNIEELDKLYDYVSYRYPMYLLIIKYKES